MSLPLRAPDPASHDPGFDGERLRPHRRGVWRFLRFLGAEPGLADDLTQEVFTRLLSRPFEDRGDAALGSWLRRTAQNLYRSAHRRVRREIATVDPEELERTWARLTEPDPSADLHLRALDRCLETLDERSRIALALRHGEGVDREAIAERLQLSVEGVKSLLRRARERLRACLKRRLEGRR